MRTIIINTLGAAYSRKDVYFLAFAPEQIRWHDCELDQLHECVQLIQEIRQKQTVRDDYQLIVLLNADSFEGTEYDDHLERLRKVLRAWLIEQLLRPLDQNDLTPACAAEIILSTRQVDNATAHIRNYCETFHVDPQDLPEVITLPYKDAAGEAHALDLTALLGHNEDEAQDLDLFAEDEEDDQTDIVAETAPKRESRLDIPDDLEKKVEKQQRKRRGITAEETFSNAIERTQSFRLRRESGKIMPIRSYLFKSKIQEQAALNSDLQINLARLIRSAGNGSIPEQARIRVHSHEEMIRLLADAEATIEELIDPASPQPIYYRLRDDLYSGSDASDMELEIRSTLRSEAGDIPGVGPALEEWESPDNREDRLEPADDLAAFARREVRSGMLLFHRERKRFQERYAELQENYDRARVLEEQRKVFDICAVNYSKWRTKERRKRPQYDSEPTELRRPLLDREKHDELIAARDRCAEGVLTQLNDYADVREDAAKLHTEFSALTRLWSPNMHILNTRYFYRFSAIMGLVFIVLMILPFFLISSQTSDLRMARMAAFLLNAGIFVLLYIVGFLIWLHKLAREIRDLRGQLELLILQSEEKRRESVLQTLSTYTRELPSCLIKQMNYNAMAALDARNAAADQKYEQHMLYLKNALKEISDVRTALRARGYGLRGEASRKRINLLLPPYDAQNQEAYMLFFERGR